MTLRFQRFFLILLSLCMLILAVFLILYNSKNNIIFFYTPKELIENNVNINEIVRVGAIVKEGSFKKIDAEKYKFVISDNIFSIYILYEGLLPDLFREGQGVVIEGKLVKENIIHASTVFAKHDENYMPESIKKELEKNQIWQKNYK
ncbi:MAG: cytochrome c maturation protein CcmE [Rickettsiales bacterium]|nr:cytochrome c maturation protein CcmE [Rickettsiales bacterium]